MQGSKTYKIENILDFASKGESKYINEMYVINNFPLCSIISSNEKVKAARRFNDEILACSH